jgi:hypothetical protein
MINSVTEERFWRKVRRHPTDCWEWTGARNKTKKKNLRELGPDRWYGAFRLVGGKQGRTVESHRVAWELTEGPIPAGMHVLHRCDNAGCVRPSHLFLGSNADNVADRKSKGRPDPGVPKKLTAEQVREVRASTMKQRDIAAQYGMSQASIWAVRNWFTYRDIE